MTEEKNEINKNNLRQNVLPPRPMPPRPPALKQTNQVEESGAEENENPNDNQQEKPQVKQERQDKTNTKSTKAGLIVDKSEQNKKKDDDSKTNDNQINKSENLEKNKKNPNKIKFWITLGLIMLGICIVILIVVLVVCRQSESVLNRPQNLRIVESDGNFYAVCDQVQGAQKYIFEIDGKKYDNDSCLFNLSKLTSPKLYSIRVYAIGNTNGSISKPSMSITHNLTKQLQTPSIHFYEKGSSLICWSKIENATNYEVMVNNSVIELTDKTQFSLNELGGGEYIIQVRAKTTKNGYFSSELSNSLHGTVFEKLQNIEGEILEHQKIKLFKVEHASRYNVTINNITFGVDRFEEDYSIIDLMQVGISEGTPITYFRIEAIGENYFISSSKEISI